MKFVKRIKIIETKLNYKREKIIIGVCDIYINFELGANKWKWLLIFPENLC